MKDFEETINQANQDFKLILPYLKKILPDYTITSLENHNDRIGLKYYLDTISGFDYLLKHEDGLKGMACRIQRCDKNYFKTFTIRQIRESGATTEFEKRKQAIKKGFLYPFYTCQAYLNQDDELMGLAVCKTASLFKLIGQGKCTINQTGSNQIGQAQFIVVNWCDFRKQDIKILKGQS